MPNSLKQLPSLTIHSREKNTLLPADVFKNQALHNTLCRIIQCIVREGLLPFTYQHAMLSIECPKSHVLLIADDILLYRMSRIEIRGPISLLKHHLKTPISSLETVFKILAKEWQHMEKKSLYGFFKEIKNSYDNMAIMLEHVHNTQHTLKSLFGTPDLTQLTENLPTNAKALFYEQWASQGHPLHPCNKVKFENPEELIAYSPEFSPIVPLSVVAIHTSLAATECEKPNQHYSHYFSNTFPQVYTQFCESLQNHALNPLLYLPLFIHPWQEKNILPTLYKKWITENKIISLPHIKIMMRPSLSFRTLYANENIPQIKLSLTVLATTSVRIVSPKSIHNSPRLSAILRSILNKNHTELSGLRLLYDSIGIRINTQNPEADEQLAMLIRDTISTTVHSDETPIISAALFSNTLKNNTPLLVEIMNAYFKTDQPTEKKVLAYFSHLTHTILQPNLFLYSHYGIALESHQQNSMIIFKNNHPIAILLKDLGGIRIYPVTLKNRGYSFDVFPDSSILAQDQKEARNLLIHTSYQSLLGECIILLSKHYHITESLLWKIVKTQTIHNLNLFFKDDPALLKSEVQELTEKDWPIKSFIAMRLTNQQAHYIYHSTQNPLASCS